MPVPVPVLAERGATGWAVGLKGGRAGRGRRGGAASADSVRLSPSQRRREHPAAGRPAGRHLLLPPAQGARLLPQVGGARGAKEGRRATFDLGARSPLYVTVKPGLEVKLLYVS